MSDAHEAWVDRCARWEKLYEEKCAENARLREFQTDAFKAITAYTEACIDFSKRLEASEAQVVERDTQIAALSAALDTATMNVEEYTDLLGEARTQIAALKAALKALFAATTPLDGWEGCDLAFDSTEVPCGNCRGCAVIEVVEARNVADDLLAAVGIPEERRK